MTRTRSSAALLAFAILLAALGAAVPIGGSPHAGAQGSDTSGYTPCEAGQDVDLLIMMDASGSLNSSTSGIDSDGELRREALQRFRDNLTSLLSGLPARDAATVQIALWRFDRNVIQIAPFSAPSSSHPTDDEIEHSLGDRISSNRFAVRGRDTDYLAALRAAAEAFRSDSHADACRLLLFFTDGVYDPIDSPTFAQADELRSEVCGAIKRDFESAGIDTYSILLGDHFEFAGDDEAASGGVLREMAKASMQAMRALTGDAGSRLVSGVPFDSQSGCRQWSDEQSADRDGAIIQIGDLEQLALQLLEVAEVAARGLVEWTNCGAVPGQGARSAPMPAGRLIEAIVAYPRDGSISGYEIASATGASRRGDGTGAAPLRLGSDALSDLEAGWTIEFTTTGGGGGIDVACYIKESAIQEPPVPEGPKQLEPVIGHVTDTDGVPLDAVRRSPAGADSPPLGVRVTSDVLPGLCRADPATVAVDAEHQRVLDWYCRADGSKVIFDLTPLECGQRLSLTAPLPLRYEFRSDDASTASAGRVAETEVQVHEPPSVLYDCLGAPVLICSTAAAGSVPQHGQHEGNGDTAFSAAQQAPVGLWPLTVEPDSHEVPREPLKAALPCVLQPPTHGVAHVEARWRPDSGAALPSDIQWRFDSELHHDGPSGVLDESGTVLTLDAAADPSGVTLHVTTSDELDNDDWTIVGAIELHPSWDPGGDDAAVTAGAAEQMSRQQATLWVDQSYLARSDSALAFWLTLLLLVASMLVSYALFCLALVRSMSLSDPNGFWLHHERVPVAQDSQGHLLLGSQAQAAIAAAPAQRIIGTSGRGGKRVSEWRADGLTVRLRHSPRWWLVGLLRGPWSAITAEGTDTVVAQPVARRKSPEPQVAFAAAVFDALEVVGSPRRVREGGLVVPIWIARPRHGSFSTDTADTRVLNELLRRLPAEDQDHPLSGDGPTPLQRDVSELGSAGRDSPPSAAPGRPSPSGGREHLPDGPPRAEPGDRPPVAPPHPHPPRRTPRDRPPPRGSQ